MIVIITIINIIIIVIIINIIIIIIVNWNVPISWLIDWFRF